MPTGAKRRGHTRGRLGRIQRLPGELKSYLDRRLREGATQADIRREMAPLLAELDEAPLSAGGLNRYATRMEKAGRRLREAREVASAWTAKFGEEPSGEVSQHIIEMLRVMAFEVTLNADEQTDEEGNSALDPAMIGHLALALERLERAAEMGAKRERALRAEFAVKAEQVAKRQGISADTAAAIRAALDEADD